MELSKRQRKLLIRSEYKKEKKNQKMLEIQAKKIPAIDYNNNNIDGCGIVLIKIINEKRYILLKYCNNIYYVPKGNRRIGESVKEGAIRELTRYTNICPEKYSIISGEPLTIVYQPYYHDTGYKYRGHSVKKHMHYFFAIVKDEIDPTVFPEGQVADNEFGSYEWICINTINSDVRNGNHYEENMDHILNHMQNINIVCDNQTE